MPAPRDDTRSDEQLVAAINAGEVAAFEALYGRHRDWVVRLAFRFTVDRDLALDVMQETFLYVLEKFPGFELKARFTTFLYPVVRHLAITHQQRARRYIAADDALKEVPAAEGAPHPDPREELACAMKRLGQEHREVVLMRFVDDFRLQEIADTLQIPLGTVKSRLHHAIRALRSDPAAKKYFKP